MEQEIDKLIIDIDVRQNKTINTINSITESIDKLKGTLSDFYDLTKSINSSGNKTSKDIVKASAGLKTMAKNLSVFKNETKNTNKSWTETKNVVNSLGQSYTQQVSYIEKLNGTLSKSTRYYDENSNLIKKVNVNVDEFKNKITTTTNYIDKNNQSIVKNNQSLVDMYAKLGLVAYAIKKSWDYLGQFVKSSNAYIENLNLFNVTFGELNDKASEFVEIYSETLALDPSQVMRNFGIFNQIASGFGLASDKAYDVAQTLTQLAYDASSFFNISIEESFLKFKSGLAGELEPLRAIGYALDEATLQQVAYNHGIEKSIRVMTQAEKAQLRTIAIYEQSKNVMNDLAQTLDSPANAMRILNQQFELFKRSLGNIIVPILTKILPTLQAFIEVLTETANKIAKFFNYEITGARTGDMITEIEGMADAYSQLDEEVSGSLLSIDKFSVLNEDKSEEELDLDIPTYDALAGAIDTNVEEIKGKIEKILPWILTIAATLTAGKIIGSIININKQLSGTVALTSGLGTTINGLSTGFAVALNPIVIGITALTAGLIYLYTTNERLRNLVNDFLGSLFNILKSILEPLLNIAKSLLNILGAFITAFEPLISLILFVTTTIINFLDKIGALGTAITIVTMAIIIFRTSLGSKLLNAIKGAYNGFQMLITRVNILSLSLGITGALGALIGLSALFDSFDDDTRKLAASITVITSAIVALTVAAFAMHTALSMGVAAPIILTSIGAGIAGLRALLKDTDGFANGGYTNANIIKTNENGLNEWIGRQGNSKVIVNDKQMDEIMMEAVEKGTYNAMYRAKSVGGNQDLVLTLDGRELARGSLSHIVNALNSNYNVNIRPS